MSNVNDFGLSAIGQIAVNAHDLDRAVGFYRDKLGMKHLFTVPPQDGFLRLCRDQAHAFASGKA